jgi:hypothetical protein
MDQIEQNRSNLAVGLGMSPESIAHAATHLGMLRNMTAAEIQANITSLENEVISHVQVAQAVNAQNWGL